MGMELDLVTVDGSNFVTARSRLGGTSGAALVSVRDEVGASPTLGAKLMVRGDTEYKVLAANTADQVCGAVGAIGDYLGSVLLSVTAAATVVIKDGTTAIFTHAFTAAVATPVEFNIGKQSLNGAWKVTTGLGMTGLAGGVFN